MQIPTSLILTDCSYGLDGGSINIEAQDQSGRTHQISLPQHRIPENFKPTQIPARLHLNGTPVALRSVAESQLLDALRTASVESVETDSQPGISASRLVLSRDIETYLEAVDESPDAAIRLLVQRVVDFVVSDEYLTIAKHLERSGLVPGEAVECCPTRQ